MSGSISVGPLPPLASPTSAPLHPPAQPPLADAAASGSAAFQSLLAGSPAPSVAVAPSPCIDPSGLSRMAGLAPIASRLPVPPGPQATGRILAACDLSMAAWPAPAAGAASLAPASAAQVEAVCPAAHGGLSAPRRLLSSFL